MKHDVVQVKFKISVPKTKWLAKINKKYPELDFKILSKFLLDDKIGNTLLQIEGPNIKKFLVDFKKLSPSLVFQILFEGEGFLLLNVKTVDPWILSALIKSQLLLIYPLTIKKGDININVIAERSKINNFLVELENKDIKFKIRSIGYFHNPVLLTKRQKEILTISKKRGYFEIPRKTSLSNLAKELKVSPSSLSETFRRINKRLSDNYLNSNI